MPIIGLLRSVRKIGVEPHSPIFDKVEGVPHKEVMLDVALGMKPDYPARRGRFKYAAKFMPRLYGHSDDEIVTHAPGAEEIRGLEGRYPGTEIQLHVHEGMRLGDIDHYDSYSHQIASIFMGAQSREELRANFAQLRDDLDIRTAPPEEVGE